MNFSRNIFDRMRFADLLFVIDGIRRSLSKFGGDAVECQSMTLSQQLASGIRALDSSVKLDAFPHDGMKIWCRV